MNKKAGLFFILFLVSLLILFCGCTSQQEIVPSIKPTTTTSTQSSFSTSPEQSTSIQSTVPTTNSPAENEYLSQIDSEQAQFAAQKALDIIASQLSFQLTNEKGEPLFKTTIANGVSLPSDATAGTPTKIEKNGISLYQVPVLSKGSKVGYVYLKMEAKRTKYGNYEKYEIEFVDSGSIGKLIGESSHGMLTYSVDYT